MRRIHIMTADTAKNNSGFCLLLAACYPIRPDNLRHDNRFLMLFFILFSIIVFSSGNVFAEDNLSRAVVKIIATKRSPDLAKPWTKQAPQEVYGSGVIINNSQILTNSHVIAYADQIYVQPYQSTEKIFCKVISQAPGVDLALLKPDDDSIFKQFPSLALAEDLPEIKSTVNVYGYPIGGKELSVTEGIVSRIEYGKLFYESSGLMITSILVQ